MREILNKLRKLSEKTHSKKPFSWYLFILFVLLIINFLSSQKISPIFFGLTNNDKKSAVEFLQKIRQSPDFAQQLKYYENIYGPSLKNEVFAKELSRELKIKQLEQILENNHQSRDILYGLYQLYLEKDDKLMAEKYLKLAKEVDPGVK